MAQRSVFGLALMLSVGSLSAAPQPTVLTLWPGYTVALPGDHCVEVSRGPDFKVLYFRDQSAPKHPILAGLYAGHNPREPECAEATARQWTASGLSFKSARGTEGCAEFLVQDPKNPERGFLHIWFGPGSKDHPQLAEDLVASIRPAPPPFDHPSDLPACK
jgi:hypothetical protein